MTYYFLDSSALIKRYIAEKGTNWIRSIAGRSAGNTLVVAQITYVEAISGTARRTREGAITSRTARAIRLVVERHLSRQYLVIGLSNSITSRAANLLENHPLRAYDAIQ